MEISCKIMKLDGFDIWMELFENDLIFLELILLYCLFRCNLFKALLIVFVALSQDVLPLIDFVYFSSLLKESIINVFPHIYYVIVNYCFDLLAFFFDLFIHTGWLFNKMINFL